MNKFILCIIALVFNGSLFSQPFQSKQQKDSVWNIWSNEDNQDSVRLKALADYAWKGYLFTQPDSAYYFAEIIKKKAHQKELPYFIANALNIQGVSLWVRSNLNQALSKLDSAKNILDRIGLQQKAATITNNIGNIYNTRGQFDKAIQYFEESYELRKKISPTKEVITSLNNLGATYNSLGETAKAISYIEKSLELLSNTGDSMALANGYNNLSALMVEQNDPENAKKWMKKAYLIRLQINDQPGIANSKTNLASVEILEKNFSKAKKLLLESAEINHSLGQKYEEAMAKFHMAEIFNQQFQSDSSIYWAKEALVTFDSIKSYSGQIKTHIMLAGSNLYMGNVKNAENHLNKAEQILSEYPNPKYELDFYKLKYTFHEKNEEFEKAKESLNHLISHHFKNLDINYFKFTENKKELYFEQMYPDFKRYYRFALEHKDEFPELKDSVANMILRSKGLTLQSTSQIKKGILTSQDDELIALYDQWMALKGKIAEYHSKGKSLPQYELQASKIEKELIKKSSEFKDVSRIITSEWKDLEEQMMDNEAIVSFIDFKDKDSTVRYAACIIKKGLEHPLLIPVDENRNLETLLNGINQSSQSFVRELYGTQSKPNLSLYEAVWEPVENELKGKSSIYLTPSGVLHKVSFSAIFDKKKQPLIKHYNITVLNSPSQVVKIKTNKDRNSSYLLMGGVNFDETNKDEVVWSYLPGTLDEVQKIQQSVATNDHNVKLFKEDDASEKTFVDEAPESNVIHIATHGFFFPSPDQVKKVSDQMIDEKETGEIEFRGVDLSNASQEAMYNYVNNKNPLMRSGIVLSGANKAWFGNQSGGEGILTASEVSNMNLNKTNLVVLSACETGLGDIQGSEGVYGLQRAFKMAGVNHLIMSLWKVPDKETAEFMSVFYELLSEQNDVKEAFNKTQNRLQKKYDPYYWGAFILIE